jgi:hypothetical protein
MNRDATPKSDGLRAMREAEFDKQKTASVKQEKPVDKPKAPKVKKT